MIHKVMKGKETVYKNPQKTFKYIFIIRGGEGGERGEREGGGVKSSRIYKILSAPIYNKQFYEKKIKNVS